MDIYLFCFYSFFCSFCSVFRVPSFGLKVLTEASGFRVKNSRISLLSQDKLYVHISYTIHYIGRRTAQCDCFFSNFVFRILNFVLRISCFVLRISCFVFRASCFVLRASCFEIGICVFILFHQFQSLLCHHPRFTCHFVLVKIGCVVGTYQYLGDFGAEFYCVTYRQIQFNFATLEPEVFFPINQKSRLNKY